MKRRTFLGAALAAFSADRVFAALRGGRWDDAADVLKQATATGQVRAAVRCVQISGSCTASPPEHYRRRHQDDPDRCADRLRDQPESGRRGGGESLPR